MPAAVICAVMSNIHRDDSARPEPWRAADFMPGAKTEQDEMREFVEAIERGDTFDVDPADMAVFKRKLESTFSNIA